MHSSHFAFLVTAYLGVEHTHLVYLGSRTASIVQKRKAQTYRITTSYYLAPREAPEGANNTLATTSRTSWEWNHSASVFWRLAFLLTSGFVPVVACVRDPFKGSYCSIARV